jgi:AcrR family transcriptional regulator
VPQKAPDFQPLPSIKRWRKPLNIVQKTREKYMEYEKRHEQILCVAIRLFNEKGYHATTTASIANEAGVHEPTLYKHFKKKKDLYLACFQSVVEQLSGKYKKVYREHKDDVAEYLKSITRVYIDFVEHHPDKSMFLVHLLSNRNEKAIYGVFKDFLEKSIKGVENVLAAAAANGKIRLNPKRPHDIRLLASIFICQYFTVVAVRDFVNPGYLKSETCLNYTLGLLQIKGERHE